MSYIRYNEPLRYVKGISSGYVFSSYAKPDEDGEVSTFVEDYGNEYIDKNTLLDLVCRIVQRETDDEKFTFRIAKAMAKHMGIQNALRDKPLTGSQWEKEASEISEKIHADPSYREFIEEVTKKKARNNPGSLVGKPGIASGLTTKRPTVPKKTLRMLPTKQGAFSNKKSSGKTNGVIRRRTSNS